MPCNFVVAGRRERDSKRGRERDSKRGRERDSKRGKAEAKWKEIALINFKGVGLRGDKQWTKQKERRV